MSGGYFDYNYFRISQFAEELQHELDTNETKAELSESTVTVLQKCQKIIEKAGKLAREVEWLYSGDHGEESFLKIVELILEDNNGTM